ncbi:MAG: O-methyltransferase [Gammaproteobacteria bacterium]
MSTRTLTMTDSLYDYLLTETLRERPLLARLRDATAKLSNASMQISPEQGQFMALLVKLIGARRCLEIGTFTGYSSTVVALALPEDGRLTCLDVSEEYTRHARAAWREAEVEEKIELKLAPARDSLAKMLAAGEAGSFDFAFIDADKENYPHYYEAALELLHPGGLIAVDNTLWGGDVADPANTEPDTVAIRELNRKVRGDDRVDMSLLPVGDGLLLVRKR